MPRRGKKKTPLPVSSGALVTAGAAAEIAPAAPKDAAELKELGAKAFASQNFSQALTHFSNAIEECSKDQKQKDTMLHLLLSNRSATYSALQKFNEALADAQSVIALKPEWGKAHFRAGQAMEGLYMYAQASIEYRACLAIDKDDVPAKAALAKLQEILDELKISDREIEKKANPDSDKYERMIEWMRKGGCRYPKMYMQYYSEDYRGVHALCKIGSNEEILYVPVNMIMTNEVAKESYIGQKIIRSGYDVRSTDSYLACFLLTEKAKGAESKWKPYLDILPQKYENMPVYFDDSLLSLLKGSFSLEMRADRIKSLQQEYEGICNGVPEFKQFTYDQFVWGRLVVITRQFGITVNKIETDGLVPYADMLNHKLPRQTEWSFDTKLDGFTITTLKSIERGEQLFDSYGRKCNSRFFVNYGFSIDENDDNEAVIRLELPRSDPQYSIKFGLLGNKPWNAKKRFQMPANVTDAKTQGLFSFLRFLNAEGKELMYLSQLDTTDAENLKIAPLSVSNEKAVLQMLKFEAKKNMDAFISTIEEDAKMLKDDVNYPMFSNIRNCIVMRWGEKKVLQFFIDLADRALPLLDMPWADLKRIAAKAKQAATPIDIYITGVIVPLVNGKIKTK